MLDAMAVGATKPERAATEADLLALPEEGRGWELLDGELVEKQGGFRHGLAHFRLQGPLAPYARRSRGGDRPGGWWFLIEQLVRFDSGQTLRPDVAGWLRERLPEPPEDDDAVIAVRPDWIAEIVSPSNCGCQVDADRPQAGRRRLGRQYGSTKPPQGARENTNAANDLVKKRRIYHRHGVPHYWLVDPRDESLTVLRWTPEGYLGALVALRDERVRAEPFAAVEWLVGVLFGDDDDGPPAEG
jgi:Uma2 family endonuclease